MRRLAQISDGAEAIQRPDYDPAAHGSGIVHLGPGAFHRAHQAVYTDAALAAAGGDWRIACVSLRSATAAEALAPQNGLYTLLVDGAAPRMIGAISGCRTLRDARADVLATLADPAIRIITLTVTEKAYGPGGAEMIALLLEALSARRRAGAAAPTLLSCDNLPGNGEVLRRTLCEAAQPDLAAWIADEVACPSSMVDRITPAPTDAVRTRVEATCGYRDHAAVATEPFTQWVIEDRFPTGRPAWEAGGAVFVADVTPFEAMKLRMLNGAHSLLAYGGLLSGHRYVREAIVDPPLRALTARLMGDAAATLGPVPGMDLDRYRAELIARFENREMDHELRQIAVDGSQKLPQRILAPARAALEHRRSAEVLATAAGAWLAYLAQTDLPEIQDHLAETLKPLLNQRGAVAVGDVLSVLGLARDDRLMQADFISTVARALRDIQTHGVAPAADGRAKENRP